MEILVLHPGALGDVILCFPALALLRSHPRAVKITLAASPDGLSSICRNYADRVISPAAFPLHRLYGHDALPLEDLWLWRHYDGIVSWTGFGDSEFTCRLSAAHPNALVAGWRPGPNEERHVSKIFVDSLAPWVALPQRIIPTKIVLNSLDLSAGMRWLVDRGWSAGRSLLAIHPGAGSGSKRWPLGNFREIGGRWLRNPLSRVLAIEGPAEPGLATDLAEGLRSDRVLVLECPPLGLLSGVLAYCGIFLGNDAGVAHLAAALGISCLVLFGPTSPEQWAPLGEHVTVMRDDCGCVACEKGQSSDHKCLQNLLPGRIWQELGRIAWRP